MTTPTGTITMLDIQTEFGGVAPIGLDEYYAGGLYVPAGTSGVPSSGTISMDNLRGKTKAVSITVSVSHSSRLEGEFFVIQFTAPVFLYPTLYWKLTNYTNLQDADFNVTTGAVNYDSESGSYSSDTFRAIVDSEFEGAGTFKLSVYSDSARTLLVGESTTLTVTDTFSTGTSSLTRTELWRYANLNSSLKSTIFTLNTTGLVGGTIYYEIFTTTSGATLSSQDIAEPLTGTITVPAGGVVSRSVTATEWEPAINIVKNVQVRFRLQNSAGILLGTSGNITLNRTPVITFTPFSPATIREGQTTTVTATANYIPVTSPASASIFFTTDGTATLSADFLNFSVNTGEILFTSSTASLSLTAKIDELFDANETLRLIMRKTSTSGTAFWIVGDNAAGGNPPLSIAGPAIIDSVSASIGAVQITSISSYPLSRTFTVQFRNGSGSFNTSNVTSPSSITVAANQTSSNTLQMLSDPGGNSAAHSIQYLFESPGYLPYSPPVANETFTWPVYGLEIFASGTNAQGAAITITARITSTPAYGTSRVFQFQYRVRTPGTTTWGAWANLNTVTVAASSTSSLNTTIASGTTTAQLDVQGRVVLAGQQLRESNILLNRWI